MADTQDPVTSVRSTNEFRKTREISDIVIQGAAEIKYWP